jgi:hypothetical protein
MEEEFRQITNYENYSISNFGRLKNNKTNRILKLSTKNRRYVTCRIINEDGFKTTTIHILVALMFIGERPKDYEVDHIDNNKLNNNINNLQYISRSQNMSKIPPQSKCRKNKTNEYYNIGFNKKKNNNNIMSYSVRIKQKYLGSFKTLEEAIKIRDNYILNYI